MIRAPHRAMAPLVLSLALLAGCASLPENYPRQESHALSDTGDTRLARMLAPQLARHGARSGAYPLESGLDAFVARIVLAEAAQRSLDLQYYIWHGDTSGKLLLDALLRAADRGVRVRLLLDDVGTAANDDALLMVAAHPNVEVRLFNPLATRGARTLGLLAEFERTNRRMHNKSFAADNQMGIVGGRNIGDEYFAAHEDVEMRDFDVIAVGPVVAQVSGAFDMYWNSDMAYPIEALARNAPDVQAVAQARAALRAFVDSQKDGPYAQALLKSPLAARLRGNAVEYFWGDARMVFDDPQKIAAAPSEQETHLQSKLRSEVTPPESELLVLSPYFVPGDAGVESLRRLRQRGVKVRIVTNSLASTDVVSVHSGYQRYRKPLLEAGVELYELKPSAAQKADEAAKRRSDAASGVSGSKRAALHAKTMVADQRTLFVGSMNLDPRSLFLNTEIGVILEMPEMARAFVRRLDGDLRGSAYRLALSPEGAAGSDRRVEWIALEDGREVRYATDPGASFWRRLGAGLMSLLPIESQL
jgi:putative cardiolipin synthase